MKLHAYYPKIANSFGMIGYFSVAMQWLWTATVLDYPLLTELATDQPKTRPVASPPDFSLQLPPQITLFIVVLITVIMVLVSILIIVLTPKKIASQTAAITQTAATAAAPLIAAAPKAAKKRRAFSARVMLGIKSLLWLIPLLAIYFAPHNAPLPYGVVSAAALFCAAITALCFGLQYALARLLGVSLTSLR